MWAQYVSIECNNDIVCRLHQVTESRVQRPETRLHIDRYETADVVDGALGGPGIGYIMTSDSTPHGVTLSSPSSYLHIISVMFRSLRPRNVLHHSLLTRLPELQVAEDTRHPRIVPRLARAAACECPRSLEPARQSHTIL